MMSSQYGRQTAMVIDRFREFTVLVICCALALVLTLTLSPASYAQGMLGGGANAPGMGTPSSLAKERRREPQYAPVGPQIPVAEVRITGNDAVSTDKIRSYLQTRVRRAFDPELVQRDVRALMATRLFRDVKTLKEETDEGIVITYEVVEQPTVHYIRLEGNELSEKKLIKQTGLSIGSALNPYAVEEARRKLEQYYHDKGYTDATVEIREGAQSGDRGVVFGVTEGNRVRVWNTKIEGNTFLSDSVLETRAGLQTKHGILWLVNGQLKKDELEQDVQRLTAYYRRFGFYQAVVRGEVEPNSSGKWVTAVFHVEEGPRFAVHDIKIEGNKVFDEELLRELLQLNSGESFVLDEMQRDLARIRDHYGGQGYVFADIKAEPTFLLGDSAELDIVYHVEEGRPAYVDNIYVNIRGSHPHTKKSLVINTAGISPMKLIDIREVRAAERRLGASGIFLNDPSRGVRPEIEILPKIDGGGQVLPANYDEESGSTQIE
ncbi:MAG: hypothetical protein O2931_06955 [Planctomycetota bacterium]|nr:hypothetical protein [Planctomycetota bacterium]MDA1178518.1 hypothetical protein [Planctomycetota bacterium]